VDGFFVAIGHIPNTQPFVGQLDLDPDGYIIGHGGARTNIPRIRRRRMRSDVEKNSPAADRLTPDLRLIYA
jgi:alkyl hydroperoxide reductase subunit AhpF